MGYSANSVCVCVCVCVCGGERVGIEGEGVEGRDIYLVDVCLCWISTLLRIVIA